MPVYYPIAIETGTKETAFGVVVPDLVGCFAAGETRSSLIASLTLSHYQSMSHQYNPAHPRLVLREYIPKSMTINQAAQGLQIPRKTLAKVLYGHGRITADLALRLAAWLSTSPDVWLNMQMKYDLWQAKQQPQPEIQPLTSI